MPTPTGYRSPTANRRKPTRRRPPPRPDVTLGQGPRSGHTAPRPAPVRARAEAGAGRGKARARARVRPKHSKEYYRAHRAADRRRREINAAEVLSALRRIQGGGGNGWKSAMRGGLFEDADDKIADAAVRGFRTAFPSPRTRSLIGPPVPGRDRPGPFLSSTERSRITGATAVPTVIGSSAYSKNARALAKALQRDPWATTTNTVKGFGDIAVGTVGAVGQAVREPSSVKDIPAATWRDLQRRYGGTEEELAKRFEEEGVAAEILDASIVLSGGGAAVGRGLGAAARRGKLGPKAKRVATSRPKLQTSGNKFREQDVSRNLFRAFAQAGEDVMRRKAQRKREERAERRGEPVRGLPPVRPDVVVPATRRGQRRAQRREVAQQQSRDFQGFKQEDRREVDRGVRRELGKLSRKQRAAVFHAAQGLVDPTDPARAVAQLRKRREQIIQARDGKTVPRVLRKTNDEVALIDYLIRNSGEVFGDGKLAAFQAKAADRSARLETLEAKGGAYREATAVARRLRPQAELLRVPFPDDLIRRLDDALSEARRNGDGREVAALQGAKRDVQVQFIEAVRARAREEGLPEPAFVTHQPRAREGRAERALGGSGAVQGPKRSEMRLFREGRADVRPQALEQSVTRSVKRRHNWRTVAKQAETSAVVIGRDDVKRAIGSDKSPDDLTIHEWRKVLDSKGWDERDFAFWNPGRMGVHRDRLPDNATDRFESETLDGTGGRELDVAVKDALRPADQVTDELQKTKGWRLVPREAYEEITAGATPSGWMGRGVQKVQGFQSRILLGLNPSWIQMQVAANALLGMGATRGNAAAFLRSPLFWRGVDRKTRDAVDRELGSSVLRAHGQKTHLGAAADNETVNFIRALGETRPFQSLARANPMDAIFGVDELQNRYFRRTVLYNEAKRQAYRDMGREMGQAYRASRQIADILTLRDPKERMEAILRNQDALERHARHVNGFLGDYTTFTAKERRVLKRAILFYGFLRHSTKLAFYTMPVKHPVMLSLVGKLGQLHVQEVKDLLGGDQAPWAYSKVYFDKRTGKLAIRDTPDAAIESVDFARINPVANPLIEVLQEGPKALGGMMSPLLQSVVNQAYARELFTGLGYRVGGDPNENPNPSAGQRARIFASDLLSTAYPYREAVKARADGRTQGDDSLLFSERPLNYAPGGEGAANEAERIRRRESDHPLAGLLPLVFPRADNSRDIVRKRQRESGERIESRGKGVDWSKVRIPRGGQGVDWRKVKIK